MTYAMLYQILTEAEARRDDERLPQQVRDNSAETVSLCKMRMASEGITRDQLKTLARAK